jgi:hypothetical protein
MRWRELQESFTDPDYFDGTLYHATDRQNVESCLADGVRPTSYWGIGVLAEYYVGCCDDEDDEGVVLTASLSDFDESLLEPDYPGLEEPITYTLRKSEDEIWTEWEASAKTWRDSLRIIGSVRYRGTIKPRLDDGY